jgi:hypothetical protein
LFRGQIEHVETISEKESLSTLASIEIEQPAYMSCKFLMASCRTRVNSLSSLGIQDDEAGTTYWVFISGWNNLVMDATHYKLIFRLHLYSLWDLGFSQYPHAAIWLGAGI